MNDEYKTVKPVAWRYRDKTRSVVSWNVTGDIPSDYNRDEWEVEPLYTHPQPVTPAGGEVDHELQRKWFRAGWDMYVQIHGETHPPVADAALVQRLIEQLPSDHDGRNTWLLNYGVGDEADWLRAEHKRYRQAWADHREGYPQPVRLRYQDAALNQRGGG